MAGTVSSAKHDIHSAALANTAKLIEQARRQFQMEINKKDNSFTEGLLLICAIAIAASMVQIGFLLAPMSERAADINQCVKERTAYWMKNDKKPGPHTKSRLTSWCNGGRRG